MDRVTRPRLMRRRARGCFPRLLTRERCRIPNHRENTAQAVSGSQRRQVTVPGAAKPRAGGVRGGLLLLGLVLVVASGGGFWYVLQSVDERQEYVMAARTIERWEVVQAADFVRVEANLGEASALPVRQIGAVTGGWATGRIPAGTLVTPGMFEAPPLSGEDEAHKVLIQVNLPAGEAPQGELKTGDRVALFGAEPSAIEGVEPPAGLIGVLTLRDVQGGTLTYVVTPAEAKAITEMVGRYESASNRWMWKIGFDLSIAELVELFGASGGVGQVTELGGVRQPAGDQ